MEKVLNKSVILMHNGITFKVPLKVALQSKFLTLLTKRGRPFLIRDELEFEQMVQILEAMDNEDPCKSIEENPYFSKEPIEIFQTFKKLQIDATDLWLILDRKAKYSIPKEGIKKVYLTDSVKRNKAYMKATSKRVAKQILHKKDSLSLDSYIKRINLKLLPFVADEYLKAGGTIQSVWFLRDSLDGLRFLKELIQIAPLPLLKEALLLAAKDGSLSLFEKCLSSDRFIDLSGCDCLGKVLVVIAKHGKIDLLKKFFLSSCYNKIYKMHREQAFVLASKNGFLAIVEALVDCNDYITQTDNKTLRNAFTNAVLEATKNAHSNVVKYLLNRKEINLIFTTELAQVIKYAASKKYITIIQYLLTCDRVKYNIKEYLNEISEHPISEDVFSNLYDALVTLKNDTQIDEALFRSFITEITSAKKRIKKPSNN